MVGCEEQERKTGGRRFPGHGRPGGSSRCPRRSATAQHAAGLKEGLRGSQGGQSREDAERRPGWRGHGVRSLRPLPCTLGIPSGSSDCPRPKLRGAGPEAGPRGALRAGAAPPKGGPYPLRSPP